ncbi:MAG: hypothetical protein KDA37_10045, partial [Planctomycetales bacterium]|nr:hypothetical protein [Planctomycetales bacterium]
MRITPIAIGEVQAACHGPWCEPDAHQRVGGVFPRTARAAFLLAVLWSAAPAFAVNYAWVGGISDIWSTSGNWDGGDLNPPGPPGSSDTATIGSQALRPDVQLDIDTPQINGLTMTSGVTLSTNGHRLFVNDGVNSALTSLSGAGTTLIIDSGPLAFDVDTDLLTIGSGATVDMAGGDMQVDSGPLTIGSGGILSGYGSVHVDQSVASSTALLVNNGLLRSSRPDLSPTTSHYELAIQSSDADARLDLDGSSGNGQVSLDFNTTLNLDVPILEPFSDLVTLNQASVLDVASNWSADSLSTFEIDADQIVQVGSAAPRSATIRGGDLTASGVIHVDSGTAVFEADLHATSSASITVDSDARIRFDGDAVIDSGAAFTL